MDFESEEAEERYWRRKSRSMKVCPERLAERLQPQGFLLVEAWLPNGINEIRLLRAHPELESLFETVQLKGDPTGEEVDVSLKVSLVPDRASEYVSAHWYCPATLYGYTTEYADLTAKQQALDFEARLADWLPRLFQELTEASGHKLLEDSVQSRLAAERYLIRLMPSVSLQETHSRISQQAESRDFDLMRTMLDGEIRPFGTNLVEQRLVAETAALCHILYRESDEPFHSWYSSRHTVPYKPKTCDLEAHRRYYLVGSRLSRSPGYPKVDRLVPNRDDELHNLTPWRGRPADRVADCADDYLEAGNHRCECGKRLFYVSHVLSAHDTLAGATMTTRCTNGHDALIVIPEGGLAKVP